MTEPRAQGEPGPDGWRLVTEHGLAQYPCGVRAGTSVRLRQRLIVKDHAGNATGPTHEAGELWAVLRGSVEEPGTIWLREPGGDSHTWDAATFWDWFERESPRA